MRAILAVTIEAAPRLENRLQRATNEQFVVLVEQKYRNQPNVVGISGQKRTAAS
jgi:hypothetical protein